MLSHRRSSRVRSCLVSFALSVGVAACSDGGSPSPGGAGGSAGSSSGAGGTTANGGSASSAGGAGGSSAGTGGGAGAAGGSSSSGGSAGATAGGSGGSGGSSGSGGSGTITPGGDWHGEITSLVSEETLNQAYTDWKAKHVKACDDGSSVVEKDPGAVVSESIAYGMLLSAAFGDRELFDRLYKFYGDHLDQNGLMNWQMASCAAPGDNDSNAATDGDLDAAMALVQANERWSDGGYLAEAESLAGKILEHEVVDCDGRATLKPGDAWGGCLDESNETRINPSYFAPAYYRVFAAKFQSQAAEWNALLEGTYELYPILQARMEGLVPDWSDYDGSDWYGSGYSYDACRTPWRVATDYAWSGEARAQTFMQNVVGWVDSKGGLPGAAQQQNSAFLGAFALAASYDQAKFDAYVSAWLGATVDDQPYFQGTLRLLYLLVATGRFSPGL